MDSFCDEAEPVTAPVSVKKKWWTPRDILKKDIFENTKRDISHFLTVSQEGVPFSTFLYEFEEVTGSKVPFRDLGFKTVGEMLFHMDDIINVRQDNRHGTLFLYVGNWAPIEEEIIHIRQLVIAQSISDKTKNLNTKGLKGMRLNSHEVPVEILMAAEKRKVCNSFTQQRSTGMQTKRMGSRKQNPNGFAPWRDDRLRATAETGEPIQSENDASSLSFDNSSLDIQNYKANTSNLLGFPNLSSAIVALPQFDVKPIINLK